MPKPHVNTVKTVKKVLPIKWFTNVAKSLGYASADVIREIAPSISDFVVSNRETAIDLVKDLRQSKVILKRFAKMIDDSEHMKLLRDAATNAVQDLKEGTIYNQARVEKNIEAEMFEDFDMTPITGDREKVEPTLRLEDAIIRSSAMSSAPIVSALSHQTEVIAKTAASSAKMQASMTQQQMLFDKRIGDSMIGGLSSINDNISALVNFQSTSMSKYIGASLKYYEDNLRMIGEQVGELKKLTEGITPKTQTRAPEDQMRQAFLSTGGIDIKGYLGVLKKNFMGAAEYSPVTGQVISMLREPAALKQFSANPLMFLATKIATAFIPSALKMAMSSLDKSFSSFFPALFMKINRLKSSPVSMLFDFGEAFGVKMPSKRTADMSLYKRGQIAFDGETKTAITDVIPGYLRKILSAISGQEEIGFDFTQRKFRTVHAMKEEFTRAKEYAATGEFKDTQRVIDIMLNKMVRFQDPESKKDFRRQMDQFFIRLAQRDALVNPNLYEKNGEVIDELKDVYGFEDTHSQELFAKIMRAMSKTHMKTFGKEHIAAKESTKRLYEKIEENPLLYNFATIFGFKGSDEHLNRHEKTGAVKGKSKTPGLFGADEIGNTSTDYLREMTKMLAEGIIVYPHTPGGGTSTSAHARAHGRDPLSGPNGIFSYRDNLLKKQKEDTEAAIKRARGPERTGRNVSEVYKRKQAERDRLKGLTPVEGSYEFKDVNAGQMTEAAYEQFYGEEERYKHKTGIASWLGKFLKGGAQDKYNMMLETVNKVLSTPVKLLTGFLEKVDNSMYEIIFGKGTAKGEKFSFFNITLEKITGSFTTFFKWTQTKFFEPLSKLLIGKDGILTKLSESNFVKSIKEKGAAAIKYMFGTYDEASNKLSGGLFTDVGNEILGIGKSVRYYFTGKSYTDPITGKNHPDNPNSVFGEVGKVFKDFGGNLKKYFFGDKESTDPSQSKGIFGSIGSGLMEGFRNFHGLIFGHEKMQGARQTFDQFTQTMKERAPKALAWGTIGAGAGLLLGGKLGILGALFLPGGPIGGAIVGTALGFLSQSDKFKDWAFGAMDTTTNERVGGFVSQSTQRFIKKHKVGIIGGATIGAAKAIMGFGLLPGMVIAGPITGALMGIATSLLWRSDKFQNWLFGKMGDDNERHNGIFARLFGKIRGKKSSEETKQMFGNAGAGAIGGAGLAAIVGQFGILGLAMTPGGAIGGAILGAAAGILISSKKWREKLFGVEGEDNLRHGGIFGKLINWTNMQIMEPMRLKFDAMKLNIGEWFTKSIKNPFLDALEPMKAMYHDFFDNMKKMFKAGWDGFTGMLGNVFEKFVGLPFGKFMENNVMKPLRSFFSRIIGGLGHALGSILAAPIKALSMITGGYTEGREAKAKAGWMKTKKFREKGGILYAIGARMFGAYSKEDRAELEAKMNEEIPYREKTYAAKEKRDKAATEKYDKLQREQKAKEDAHAAKINRYVSEGYNNLPEDKVPPVTPPPTLDRFQGTAQDVSTGAVVDTRTATQKKKDKKAANKAKKSGGATISEEALQTGKKPSKREQKKDRNLAVAEEKKAAIAEAQLREKDKKSKKGTGATIPEDQATANLQADIQAKSKGKAAQTTTAGAIPTNGGKGGGLPAASDILKQIAEDVKAIRKHMETNMNGVGYNMNAIKNILRKKFGMKEGEGEQDFENKEYRTWFQKLKDMLMSPFTWFKKKALAVWNNLTDSVKKVWDKITGLGTLVMKGLTAVKDGFLWAAKTIITSVAHLIEIPWELAKAFGNGVKYLGQISLELIQDVGPALKEGLLNIAKMFGSLVELIAKPIQGFGIMLKESLVGFGKGVGEILWGIGEIGYAGMKLFADGMLAAGPMIVEFLTKSTEMAVKFTLDTIKFVGEQFIDVGKSVLNFLLSPIKFLGNIVGKLFSFTQKVEVVGGVLDTVRHIEQIGGEKPKTTITGKAEPMPVQIVGTDRCIPICVPTKVTPNGFVDNAAGAGFRTGVAHILGGVSGGGVASNTMGGQVAMDLTTTPHVKDEAKIEADRALLEEEGGAKHRITERTTLREKWDEIKNRMKQVTLLQKIADGTKRFKEGWDAIFSTKGLITGALLLGLPLLWKAFKWIASKGGLINVIGKGLGDIAGLIGKGISNAFSAILCKLGFSSFCDKTGGAPVERVDAEGNVIPDSLTQEHLFTAGVKAGVPIVGKAAVLGGKILSRTGKIIAGAETIGRKILTTGKKIVASRKTADIVKTFAKPPTATLATPAPKPPILPAASGAGAAELKATTETIQKGKIAQFIESVTNSITNILKAAEEKLVTYKMKLPSASVMGKIMGKLSRVFTSPILLAKYMPKILAAIGRGAAASAPWIAAGFFAWGAISGWTEANHLFGIEPGVEPDVWMKMISSLMKGLLNVSWFVVIALLDDICRSEFDFSFLNTIATILYEFIVGADKAADLKQEQLKLEEDVDIYNKINGTKLSKAAYIDMQNKSLFQKTKEFLGFGEKTPIPIRAKELLKAGKSVDEVYGLLRADKVSEVEIYNAVIGAQKELETVKVTKTTTVTTPATTPLIGPVAYTPDTTTPFIGPVAYTPDTTTPFIGPVAYTPDTTTPFIGPVAYTPDTTTPFMQMPGFKPDTKIPPFMKGPGTTPTPPPESVPGSPSWITKMNDDILTEMQKRLGIRDKTKALTPGQLVAGVISDGIIGMLGPELVDEKGAKTITTTVYGTMLKAQTEFDYWWKQIKLGWYQGVVKPFEDLGKWIGNKLWDLGQWWDGDPKTGFWPRLKKQSYESVIKPFEDIGKWIGNKLWDLGQWWDGDNMSFWPTLKRTAHDAVIAPFERIGKAIGDKLTDLGQWWDGDKLSFWPTLKRTTYESVIKPFEDIGKWLGNLPTKLDDWWGDLKTNVGKKLGWVGEDARRVAAAEVAPGPGYKPDTQQRVTQLIKQNKLGPEIRQILKKEGYADETDASFSSMVKTAVIERESGQGGQGGSNSKSPKGGYGELVNGFAYYSQKDTKWAQSPYLKSGSSAIFTDDKDTMGWRGCGPTAMAMVASQLTGQDVEPPVLAKLATKGNFSTDAGTSWGFFPAMAKRLGLNITPMEDAKSAQMFPDLVAKGIPVILSGTTPAGASRSESPFTPNGHFVVATKVSGDKVIVNNPIDKSTSRAYDLSTVLSQLSGAWGFSNPSGANNMTSASMAELTSSTEEGDQSSSVLDLFPQLLKSIYGKSEMGQMEDFVTNTVGEISKKALAPLLMSGNVSDMKWDDVLNNLSGPTYIASSKGKNLTKFEAMDESQINQWLDKTAPKDSPFRGQGAVFLKASNETGLDPRYIVAHAAHESAWGTSQIARDKNNYFGIGAFNETPYQSALSFSSGLEAGIVGGAKWIKKNYIDRGQDSTYSMIYGDPSHRYAVYDDGRPNDNWAKSIDSIMASAYAGGAGMGGVAPYARNSLQFTDKRMTPDLLNFANTGNNKATEELLQKAVDVLGVISGHTGNTVSGLDDLSKKGIRVDVNTNMNGTSPVHSVLGTGNVSINPINLSTGGGPLGSQLQDNKSAKYNREYNVASEIARGRKY